MPATNSTHRFHSWSHTGGLGVPQPDNREETQLHGDTEACMAVLNNYYGDGGWRRSHLFYRHLQQNDHFISTSTAARSLTGKLHKLSLRWWPPSCSWATLGGIRPQPSSVVYLK